MRRHCLVEDTPYWYWLISVVHSYSVGILGRKIKDTIAQPTVSKQIGRILQKKEGSYNKSPTKIN